MTSFVAHHVNIHSLSRTARRRRGRSKITISRVMSLANFAPARRASPAGEIRDSGRPALSEPRREPSIHELLTTAESRALGFIVIMACTQLSWQAGVVAELLFSGSIAAPSDALMPEQMAEALEMTIDQTEAVIAQAKEVAHEICRSELGIASPWGC